MRIDVVTIFPSYFTPLGESLIGRAITEGRLAVGIHDLRQWTDDPHRTVDDAPYGGGPGMLMTPVPWGRALDETLLLRPPPAAGSVLVIPTPSGRRFTQGDAENLVSTGHVVIACGRYEGIDARVAEHYRARAEATAGAEHPEAARLRVAEVSLCDAVLAGGEVAALAIIEAAARLLPGVLGNADSPREDSFGPVWDGLVEGPSYTRPEQWRGLAVPAVLRSGDHGAITRWRRAQAQARTRIMRPDLLRTAPGDDPGEPGAQAP